MLRTKNAPCLDAQVPTWSDNRRVFTPKERNLILNSSILSAIKKGELILFLGAGASANCKTATSQPLLMGGGLAEQLAAVAQLPYAKEPLDTVYEAVRDILGSRLDGFLEEQFKHVTPSPEYDVLAQYIWRRIYTLNIDDGLDRSLARISKQNINKLSASDSYFDRSPFFDTLEYIKLNGTADRIKDGLIFSPSEYAEATTKHLPWYSQCGSDFVRSPILFIGTQLNEPLLKYHIERYKSLNPSSQGVSYLIARSATEIQKAGLRKYRIEFIEGTLLDFTNWLSANLSPPSSPMDVAHENIPQLKALTSTPLALRQNFAVLFEQVIVIKREMFSTPNIQKGSTIRDFYKGFKPTWNDINEGIPAELDLLSLSIQRLKSLPPKTEQRLLPFIGPSGSGKKTLLMQICYHFSIKDNWDVFFINGAPENLLDTLTALEESSTSEVILVGLNSIEFLTESLAEALMSKRLTKTLIVASERESTWNRRGRHVLKDLYQEPTYVREFSANDAKKILVKLEQYGSWTRLGRMSEKNQIKELVDRSRKQLLIALMEATLGRGFEKIIEEEFLKIDLEDEKLFLVIVAIITDRRCEAPISLVDRALDKISILRKATNLSDALAGIVHRQGNTVTARHPVYAKHLLDRAIDPSIAAKALNALLQAFADYEAPVIRHLKRSEAVIYKSLINHRFLYEILKGKQSLIIGTYQSLEKKFESDGLFWLQYGLALRDLGQHSDALDKFRTACEAYSMPHTLHALGQQLLLSALEAEHSSIALSLADEAKSILEKLDDIYESDDTYPLVTLAEGYTAVLRVFGAEDDARDAAKSYTRRLEILYKKNPDYIRLKLSYEKMFKYAATGIWQDASSSVGK